MAATLCASSAAVAAPRTKAFTGLKPLPAAFCKPTVAQKFQAVRRSAKVERKSSTAVQASSAMEVAQVAVDTGLIFGSAAVMVGITLVGLAIGFVLLRVESLAEEGKI